MGTASYAYNEARMLEGIRAYREENRVRLAEKIAPSSTPKINLTASQEVISKVADVYKITPEVILSGRQQNHIVKAREVIVLILRRRYAYSLTRIGSIIGRHHSSIRSLEQEAAKHYNESPGLRQLVDDIAGVSLSLKRDDLGLPL